MIFNVTFEGFYVSERQYGYEFISALDAYETKQNHFSNQQEKLNTQDI